MRLVPVVATGLLLAIVGIAGHAGGLEPRRHGQESFLSRAIFASGRLWLMSDAGDVSTVHPIAKTRVKEPLPEPALDLCLLHGEPAVVTCDRQKCATWTLRRWSNERWTVHATLRASAEDFVALSCSRSATILTTRRLVELRDSDERAVRLAGALRPGLIAALHETADHIFIGINNGEWGGGLHRIDRQTGKVSTVESAVLRPTLSPVTGITSDPWRPDCVVVSVGLIHFLPFGQIVEVCGNEARRLYEKSLRKESEVVPDLGPWASPDTVAFFGLARDGDGLWAVGMDGLYRLEGGGKVSSQPLPKFEEIDGFAVSFELPGIVLVLTDIVSRRSVSGRIPIAVLRDATDRASPGESGGGLQPLR